MSGGPSFSPFERLGIAPTADRDAIRRAYATRLKSIDVARDPLAFRQLRAAYEAALSGQGAVPLLEKRPDPGPREQATEVIRQRLCTGDVTTALQLFEAADAASELPLAVVHELEQEFLARSPAAPLATLSALVQRFAWEDAAHPLRRLQPAPFRLLDRRLDAERWYHELLAPAQMRAWPLPSDRCFAARLMLRGLPHWYEWLGLSSWRLLLPTPRHALAEALKQYDLHEEWLRDRFDPRRIRRCRRQLRPVRMFAVYVIIFGSVAPIAAIVQDGDVAAALAAWVLTMLLAFIVWIILWISHAIRPPG